MRFSIQDEPKTPRGNVIAMNQFQKGPRQSPIRQAEAYWTALIRSDGIPRRSDIDPRGLENILEYTFILERIAPGVARFRLAGNHLVQLAGTEVRGMPLAAFFTADTRREISRLLENLLKTPALAELQLKSRRRGLQGAYEASMVLLPLRSDLGDVSRLLGVLVADATATPAPCRFSISNSVVKDLSHLQQREAETRHSAQGFAETQALFDHPAPHLRLVESKGD